MAGNPKAESLAAVVRNRRQQLRLTQEDVAALAGTSTRFVHSLEAGKASVRLDKVLEVLDALGLDLSLAPRRPV